MLTGLHYRYILPLCFLAVAAMVAAGARIDALQHRQASLHALNHSAAEIVRSVDLKIDAYQNSLIAIQQFSIGADLQSEALYDFARRISEPLGGWVTSFALENEGREGLRRRFTTRLPWQATPEQLPATGSEAIIATAERAAAAADPVMSDLFFSPNAKLNIFSLVVRPGADAASPDRLALNVPASFCRELMAGQEPPLLAGLTDSSGNVVCAAPGFADAVRGAQSLSDPEFQAGLAGNDGFFVARRALGQATGWTVLAALPRAAVDPGLYFGSFALLFGAIALMGSVLAVSGFELHRQRTLRIATEFYNTMSAIPGAVLRMQRVSEGWRIIFCEGLLAKLVHGSSEAEPSLLDHITQAADSAESATMKVTDAAIGSQSYRIYAQSLAASRSQTVVVAYVLEITRLKEAETIAAIAGRLSSLGEMATSISHELSQPLHVMSMAAENGLAYLDRSDASAARRKFESIVQSAGKARDIISHMLLFARGEKSALHLAAVSVDAALTSALTLVEARLRQAGCQFIRSGLAQADVTARRIELETVFVNLFLNAIRAMETRPPHEPRLLSVSLHPGAEPGTLVIDVTDSGGGIAPDVMERLFDPFVSGSAEGGTGLGLYLVRRAILGFGGSIIAENIGKGARFRITLSRA